MCVYKYEADGNMSSLPLKQYTYFYQKYALAFYVLQSDKSDGAKPVTVYTEQLIQASL